MKQTKLWLATIAVLWCSLTASAYDFEVNGIYYNLVSASDLTIEVTSGDNYYSGDVIIPSTINYSGKTMTVTSIDNFAFSNCAELIGVTIPYTVTNIGLGLFSHCEGPTNIVVESGNRIYDSRDNCNAIIETNSNTLIAGSKNTTIPNSVTNIGRDAFYGCLGLTSITIPNSVTSIGYGAFHGCSSLTSIAIPKSVTDIETFAFTGCSELTNFTIPNSVISIGDRAFEDTGWWNDQQDGLVYKDDWLLGYKGSSRPIFDIVIQDGTKHIAENALAHCAGITSVKIPNSVISIGGYAFWDCSGLTSIQIPNGVTSIGEYAFWDCSGLTSVTIPNSVTSIGRGAFDGCNALETLELNCPEIDSWFWNNHSIKEIVIGNNVTSIGEGAFRNFSGLTSVTIGNGVTSIGEYAFGYCSKLTSIQIPNNVTSIRNKAFERCSELTSVTIGNGVTSIGEDAFYDCNAIEKLELNCPEIDSWFCCKQSIKEVVLGNSVTNIGNNAFLSCSGLTSIEIPNSVTSIGNKAFSGCSGLTNIEIPNSVTSIGNNAFYGCSGLTGVEIPSSVTSIGENAFYDCPGLTSVEISNSVTSIGNNTFYGCSGLTSVEIPNSVTNIGEGAFGNCSGLTNITIPNGVISIGDNSFYKCSGLTNITIGNSVTSIGENAFYDCNAIEKLELNCPEIDSWFRGKRSIKEVTLGNSVTSIGENAFFRCSGLTSIEIPNSVTSIGNKAFYECSGLTNITIGNSVTSIGEYAFYYCNAIEKLELNCPEIDSWFRGVQSIKEVTLGNSVTSIGESAFYGCSGLINITIPNSVASIGNQAFERTAWYNNQPDGIVYAGKVLYKYKGSMPYNTDITIEEGTLGIAGYAFFNCLGLASITIPNSVSNIGEYAFSYCYALKKINSFIPAENLFVPDDYAFEGVNKETCTLYVPEGDVSAYESAAGWNEFEHIVDFDPHFTIIYVVDGEVYSTETAEYGSEVLLIDEPIREGHTFSGWSEVPKTMPANNVTVYGTFTANKYLITFKIDDEVIFSAPIEYGTSIVAPEAPEKDGYSFDGWIEMPETMPAHDVIVYGTFTKLKVETIVINDSDFSFSMEENMECGEIIYTRTFNNTDWQALYIPFEIAYEDICDDFEIADINNVHQYDHNEDGKTDETIIEAFKVTDGTLEANYPYLIRAKEAGEKTIVVTDATLYATEENSIDCSSVREKFTFTGTYKSDTLPQGEGYYTLIEGEWKPVTEAVALGAFRFSLKVDSRSGAAAAEARSIRMRIIGENGEDDSTGIDNLESTDNDGKTMVIYDLQGRKVLNTETVQEGVYIINGKKVVIK